VYLVLRTIYSHLLPHFDFWLLECVLRKIVLNMAVKYTVWLRSTVDYIDLYFGPANFSCPALDLYPDDSNKN